MASQGFTFYHVLPTERLDLALFWMPFGHVSRATRPNGVKTRPSWSWGSYIGPISYAALRADRRQPFELSETFSTQINDTISQDEAVTTHRTYTWQSTRSCLEEIIFEGDTHILRFSACSLDVSDWKFEPLKERGSEVFTKILQPGSNYRTRGGVLFESLENIAILQRGPCHVILLSENSPSRNPNYPMDKFSDRGSRLKHEKLSIPTGRLQPPFRAHSMDAQNWIDEDETLAHIMLIEWKGEVAERVTIGIMPKNEFFMASVERRDIVLG
jgi:hypothetical protein